MDVIGLDGSRFSYVMDAIGAVLIGPSNEAVELKDINRAARAITLRHGKIPVRLICIPPQEATVAEPSAPSVLVQRLHTAFVRGLERIGAGENSEYLGSGGGQGSDWRSKLVEVAGRSIRFLAGFDVVFPESNFIRDRETDYRAAIAAEMLFATQAVTVCMRGDYFGMNWTLATCVRSLEGMLSADPFRERAFEIDS